MHILKCDNCRKEIKNREQRVVAGLGWNEKELCLDCGRPVKNFLLKKKLISAEEFAKLK
ncbi:MAG: hypothetical protein Q8P75_04395 [bacterium]|nr:hypothetical protein [bacterium]